MMGQVSSKLRRTDRGYAHWCPACGEMHTVFNNWSFDGKLECPTFSPSVKITGVRAKLDERGEWHGEFEHNAEGKAIPWCCHYNITAGKIVFHNDCTHSFKSTTIDLPDLPEWMRDPPRDGA